MFFVKRMVIEHTHYFNLSNNNFIIKLHSGDERVFKEIFKKYYLPVRSFAWRFVKDNDIAEDIVQECFSVLWEKMEQEGGEIVNIRSYLYTMVRNRSLDWLKQSSMFDTSLSPSDLEDRLLEEDVEERTIMEARIWTAIDSLPDRCREVFLLNKRDGMKYKDIADKFHISVHTVDNHIQKALRLIREGAYKVYTFFFG